MLNKASNAFVIDKNKQNIILLLFSALFICFMPFAHPYLIFIPFMIHLCRVFLCSHLTIVSDIIFLLPFSNLFRLPDGKSLLFVLILIADLCFFCRRKIKVNSGLLIALFLIFYLLLRMGEQYADYLAIISGVLFLYFSIDLITPDVSVHISKLFVASVLISSIFAVMFQKTSQLSGYLIDSRTISAGNPGFRFQGLFADPNYFGACVILAFCIMFLLFTVKKIKGLQFFVGTILIATFGLMTLSKTFFIIFVFCTIAYLLMMFNKRSLIVCLGFCLLIFVVIILFNSGNIAVLESIKERFDSADNLNELTTGRSNLWILYFNKIFESPLSFLFGYGFEAPLIQGMGSHNLFLEILYHTGFFGFIALGMFVIWAMTVAYKKGLQGEKLKYRESYIFIMPLAFMIFYSSLQGMYHSMLYIECCLVLMGLMIPFAKKEE